MHGDIQLAINIAQQHELSTVLAWIARLTHGRGRNMQTLEHCYRIVRNFQLNIVHAFALQIVNM